MQTLILYRTDQKAFDIASLFKRLKERGYVQKTCSDEVSEVVHLDLRLNDEQISADVLNPADGITIRNSTPSAIRAMLTLASCVDGCVRLCDTDNSFSISLAATTTVDSVLASMMSGQHDPLA